MAEIKACSAELSRLQEIDHLLEIELVQVCDAQGRYEEKEEERIISKRPKVTEKVMIGRKYWSEDFEDISTGKFITVERSSVVRIDGVWQV